MVSNNNKQHLSLLLIKLHHTAWQSIPILAALLFFSACATVPSIQNNNKTTETPSTKASQNLDNNGGISIQEDSKIPPIPPSGIQANLNTNFVELRWIGTGSDIDVQYIIYRRLKGTSRWEKISTIATKDPNQGEYFFNDYTIEANISYEYAISVMDHYGNESDLSDVAQVEGKP